VGKIDLSSQADLCSLGKAAKLIATLPCWFKQLSLNQPVWSKIRSVFQYQGTIKLPVVTERSVLVLSVLLRPRPFLVYLLQLRQQLKGLIRVLCAHPMHCCNVLSGYITDSSKTALIFPEGLTVRSRELLPHFSTDLLNNSPLLTPPYNFIAGGS